MQNAAGQYSQQMPNGYQTGQTYSFTPANQSGVHIQIYNPSVATPGSAPVCNVNSPSYAASPNCYPSNYYTNQLGQGYNNPQYPVWNAQAAVQNPYNQSYPQQTGVQGNQTNSSSMSSAVTNSNKETEKRTIVMLTDDYIKNIENYLNSQDKEVRMMGAKEVAARAMEDPSRRDDKALNALCNKMIQDPDMKIRFIGLSLLYSRDLTGDDYTIGVLKNMQNSTSGYGQDALMAANILLKMSGQTAEKEFEITSKDKNKSKQLNKAVTIL